MRNVTSSLEKQSDYVSVLLEKKLWLQVLIGMVLGVIVGILLGPDLNLINHAFSIKLTDWIALPGNLFLQLIKLIIIPLIFTSIIVGIISNRDPKFLRRIGPKLVAYFLLTTIIATVIGYGAVSLIQPGNYVSSQEILEEATIMPVDISEINLPEAIVNLIPHNPFESMVNSDMIGIIILSIIFGIALLYTRKVHARTTINLILNLQSISVLIIKTIMYFAPIAVFSLMVKVSAQTGISTFVGLFMYVITVLLGLLVLVIFYNLIILIFTKEKPLSFMKKIKATQLLAFSTSSSAAVIPLSIQTAEEKLKVKKEISRFIIPIGATVNMDGTALYQVIATVFLAQVFGVELSFVSVLLIATITVAASIGAPAAPGVGIVILGTILSSVGIPLTGIALIIGVDRILDMTRTAVNVTGDLTATAVFDKIIKIKKVKAPSLD